MTYEESWRALRFAALQYADNRNIVLATALADAATAYAQARDENKKAARPAASSGSKVLMPFGRSKGVAVSDAPTDDLKWMLGVLKESLADESKSRFWDSNQIQHDAIEAELASRGES